MATLGIDIGGSGVKGAPVDTARGELIAERYRVPTPQPSDVSSVVDAVAEVAAQFDGFDQVGITFPGVVVDGVTRTAANVDKSWLDAPAAELFTERLGRPVTVLNDADAAGVAEMAFGGHDQHGLVVMLTFGTGIGSALFLDGVLIPNTEFGHLQVRGKDAERRAAASIRVSKGLSWHAWSKRVAEYVDIIDALLWPDLVIIGGGISKEADKFIDELPSRVKCVPALLQNQAGIVGAAMLAAEAPRLSARPASAGAA